jgi:hypothetical protein
MTGKGNYWSNSLLNLLFNATPIPNLADNAGSAPLTQLYFSLHTADPGATGDQTTNEVAYTGYARVAVPRTTTGFPTSTTEVISPGAVISWPVGTGGGGVAAFLGIGTASSGAGHLLYSGTVTPNITCGTGVQPQLTTATTISES